MVGEVVEVVPLGVWVAGDHLKAPATQLVARGQTPAAAVMFGQPRCGSMGMRRLV